VQNVNINTYTTQNTSIINSITERIATTLYQVSNETR